MKQLLIIGAGYSGLAIARAAKNDARVVGTRRDEAGLVELRQAGIATALFDAGSDAGSDAYPDLVEALQSTTHLIVCAAPGRCEPLYDPVHQALQALVVKGVPELAWIGYLSTIGVYGDHRGKWVDENTPCSSKQPRSIVRYQAEQAWTATASELGVPLAVLRLSGIYGPGRNAILNAQQGRAHMLIKPGQVFNRIHVEDLSAAVWQAARLNANGVFNVTDDEPAPPQDVIRYAHTLAGKPVPAELNFATADISPMARSFYSENKRVSNARSRALLGYNYRYPDYRQGLNAIWRAVNKNETDL